MEKIVDGFLYQSKLCPDTWNVRTWEANGVKEISVRQASYWVEVCEIHPHLDACGNLLVPEPSSSADAAEHHAAMLQKAARRAKTTCRRVIISEGFNELLTLTTRSNDVCPLLIRKRVKEWVRRMKRSLPNFRYCASYEEQKRGAMHCHIATHRLPSSAVHRGVKIKAWMLGTKIWRAIVGEGNGLCFVGGKTRFGTPRHSVMSLAKLASYVSKYIMKDYEKGAAFSNRYSRSDGCVVQKPLLEVITGFTFLDVIVATFDLKKGHDLVSHRLNRWGDGLWFCSEIPKVARSCS